MKKRKVGRPIKNKDEKHLPKASLSMPVEEYNLALEARIKYNHENGVDLSKTKFFAMCVINRSKKILGGQDIKK